MNKIFKITILLTSLITCKIFAATNQTITREETIQQINIEAEILIAKKDAAKLADYLNLLKKIQVLKLSTDEKEKYNIQIIKESLIKNLKQNFKNIIAKNSNLTAEEKNLLVQIIDNKENSAGSKVIRKLFIGLIGIPVGTSIAIGLTSALFTYIIIILSGKDDPREDGTATLITSISIDGARLGSYAGIIGGLVYLLS